MWRRAGESNPQIRWDHPLSRRAPGTDAGRTLRAEEGEGVEPSRLFAHPFSRRLPSPVGLPFQQKTHLGPGRFLCRVVAAPSPVPGVGRVGIEPTSYGLRDRCNASICYRPMAPPLGVEPRPSVFRTDAQTSYARVGKKGYPLIPLVLNYEVVKEAS
jgi:hypothetical protein